MKKIISTIQKSKFFKYLISSSIIVPVALIITIFNIRPGKAFNIYRNFAITFLLLSFTWLPLTIIVHLILLIILRKAKNIILNFIISALFLILIFFTTYFVSDLTFSSCKSKWDQYREGLSIENVSLIKNSDDIDSGAELNFIIFSKLSTNIFVTTRIELEGDIGHETMEKGFTVLIPSSNYDSYKQIIKPGDNSYKVALINKFNIDSSSYINKRLEILVEDHFKNNVGCYQEGGTILTEHILPINE